MMKEEQNFFEAESRIPFSVFIYEQPTCDWHYHKYFEFLYCTKGRYTVVIGANRYECEPGDFLIIHSMDPHFTHPVEKSGESQLLCVQLDTSVLDTDYSSYYESQFLLPFIRKEARYNQYVRTQRGSLLESILSEILLEYKSKKKGYEMCVKGNILRLFSYLIRNGFIETIEGNIASKEFSQIKPVITYLENNPDTELSVTDAAKIACMSYYHFCRLFKKATGKTFVEYQNFVRVKRAEKLLTTTTNTITEIAFETHFGSVAYFNRIFKRENSMSPAQFRKMTKQ